MKKNEKYSSVKHRFKLLTTILSWTVFVLLILIATVLLYYFITTRVLSKKDTSYRPAFGLYTIISPSMEKTLNIYDVIVNVKVKSPNDIKVGDIITFISSSASSKGMTITHRVIEISEDENGNKTFKTKGDNNTSPDPKPAVFENIIGKVIFKIPQLGRLQSILTTKGGWLILVVIPAFIIILYDILKLIRLYGAEKSIEEVNKQDLKKKEKEIETKKDIEEKLTKKYKSQRRSKYESEPLKKNSVVLEVNNKHKNKTKDVEKDDKELDIIDDNKVTKEELITVYTKEKEEKIKLKTEKEKVTNIKVNNNSNQKKVRTRKKSKKKKN